MIKFLINRPVAVFMATFAFLLMGVVASVRIPTSLMPDIAIPEITVQLTYPNNSARELETNVVRPLRNQLLQVENLQNIETETRDGFATVKLFFDYGTNTDYAFIETNEKVDASLNYLPRDIDRPRVIKASATDVPVLNLTVTLKGDYSDERFLELSNFTETVLKKRIEQLPDIALADMSGQTEAEIIVTPDRNKIRSLGITNAQLIAAIKQNNFQLGNILVQNGIYQYNFQFSNPLRTKGDIENIYLNINDRLVQLKEVAGVTVAPQLDRGLVYFNGNRAIMLSLIKQADARVYDLKENLEVLITSFEKDYPNLEFSTSQDQTKLLQVSIDNLKTSLLVGGVLAILIMFFFLKDIKLPLIIALSIPIALLVSIFFMYLFGLSINIISLSGLILGVGMMIDNSIIVIDNITQKQESGLNLFRACIEGTNEIIAPLLSSVLTTCSVFLPLLFLSGITGALFYDQAIAITIGLFSSLIVSIFFIPVIYRQLKSSNFPFETALQSDSRTSKIESWYEKGYGYFFNRKWIVYFISAVFLVIAAILLQTMEYTQLPDIREDETIANIEWNDNINVDENQKRIERVLENIPNVNSHLSQIGEQQFLLQRENTKSFSEAEVYIRSNSVDELDSIKQGLRDRLKEMYPNSTLQFTPPKTIFEQIFGTDQSRLTAEVYSRSSLEVPGEENLEEIHSLIGDKTMTEIPLKRATSIEVINENVILYDVQYEDLINELKTAFSQNFIDDLKTAEKVIPIKLDYDISATDNIVRELFVKNRNDAYIPVERLVRLHNVQQYKEITANRSGEYLGFNINTDENIEEDMREVRQAFVDHPEYDVKFSGSWIAMKELNNELIIVILVTILLLYFIMAAQFESLWQPLIILLEVPIDIGGSLLLVWLFGGSINIMTFIGIVVMSGVIINDSILKIHTINLLRKEGKNIEEAIVLGGKMRLKPILMTSLTTILALFPFLFMSGLGAELQQPLALAVIGGMTIGTFISLYFIPLVYYTFSKKSKK